MKKHKRKNKKIKSEKSELFEIPEDLDKEKGKRCEPRSAYQLFIIKEFIKQRENNPVLKNEECMFLAVKEWVKYKKANNNLIYKK